MKQVMFYDRENKTKLGGILTDDGDIICGDCGGIIPADEIGGEDDDFVILKEYENWTNLVKQYVAKIVLWFPLMKSRRISNDL